MLRKFLINFLNWQYHYQNTNGYKCASIKNKGKGIHQLEHSQTIESLMYEINYTRSNILHT
jgi:hypothetical protein